MDAFFPVGLSRKQFELLSACVESIADRTLDDLLLDAEKHLENARHESKNNAFINVPLAEALYRAIEAMSCRFDNLPQMAQPWCLGMIVYYSARDDEEDDFASPVGFEDDADVINACLRLAGLDDLCINPEDYDEF
jgi:hypothetical protein